MTDTESRAWAYLTRITPAISVVWVVVLLIFAFVVAPYGQGSSNRQPGEATWWQLVLSVYTVALHIMSIVFPARVCFAIGEITAKIKATASIKDDPKSRKTRSVRTEKGTLTVPMPLFVIMIPAYKEDMGTLEETLRVLAAHPQARHCYHVYLAMEAKEEKSNVKAQTLIDRHTKSFYKMSFTIHPEGIPGEAQGKSSNESWAAKQVLRDYPDHEVRQNVIITTMDADTHLPPRYFSQIARYHLEFPETNDITVYVPPLVFDRNLHRVPLPVRTADLMWAGAGISSLYSGSTVCIPTSVYSLPLSLVEFVGGWDTGPGAIGEDMHMYLKCFFALSGNLEVRVVYAAASQCNVSSDVRGFYGYLDGLNARYLQALRHMWGSLDTGYAIRQTVAMVNRHRKAYQGRADLPPDAPKSDWINFYKKIGFHESQLQKQPKTRPVRPRPIHKMNVYTIGHRLFEAHFLPTHLVVILTTSSIFTLLTPDFLMPRILRIALDFSGWCRLAGWLLMLVFFFRYESYHQLCVKLRKDEMRKAGMLDEMVEHDGFSNKVFQVAGVFETGLFPIGGFIFGAIPAMQAVLSHIFTDRITYVVSLKPQIALKRFARGITP
ncbi:hypothetical protein BAUCODRAFT_148743 [Baudoinia panamericana UAMH 10762]|uniref:Glycosyltransferase 2-like domain-containing protein n=1 Tax=Baudoinia panamericana (strain UAMH 10762) TaxID=717646 RepID=M2MWF9_BAUPA|nr:uncharacterized protein BAUCODRAFT_148743 [Baudoinia panamericana UAMH 10762]EMC95883.1 hypothetical protein BAUCODRAFT_148743 [Baudoinia panamericana UAMH 10762]